MDICKIVAVALAIALICSLGINVLLLEEEAIEEPRVKLKTKIHVNELQKILKKVFPYANIAFADEWYYLISKKDFDELMAYDKTDQHKYIPEVYDCDDFAYDLWRNIARHYHIALGVIGVELPDGTLHMMNIFFSAEGQVYVIEPQTDEIIPISEFDGVILDVEM